MADPLRIIVLEGDETGQELLEQAIRVLDPGVLDLDAQHLAVQDAHRLLEQLLSGLVALEDDDPQRLAHEL